MSLIYYGLLALLGRRKGLSWKHSLMLVGGVVLSSDALWCVCSGLRFGWLYPFFPDVLQLIICFFRDVVGMLFCFSRIREGTLRFGRAVKIAYLVDAVFLGCWFMFSPDQSLVDWTFAILHDYPAQIIATSFILSHVVGRIVLAGVFMAWIHRHD